MAHPVGDFEQDQPQNLAGSS